MAAPEGIFLARPDRVVNGIQLAIKDLFDTSGLTTTYGSAIFADHVPTRSAEAVLRLEAAGYANVGKTNLHEFAYGITSENPHFGTVPNPLAPGRIAGGSSGGSAAAVTAGLADAALGSDSGGSIRIPAACCGIVGFKPTFDLVPAGGCFPLAPTFDHVGPMAGSVEECESMLAVLSPSFRPQRLGSLEEVAIGVVAVDAVQPLVAARLQEAAALFPRRRPIELAYPTAVQPLFMREVADVHRDLYAEHSALYGAEVAAKIEECFAVDDQAVSAATDARASYRAAAEQALEGLDLLLTPTLPCVAPPTGLGDRKLRPELVRFTFPFNVLGWPALALPCGPAEHGLPASAQLVGRAGADALVLAAGRLLASLVPRCPIESRAACAARAARPARGADAAAS